MQKQKLSSLTRSENVGAISLAAITLFGSAAMAKVSRSFYTEVTTNPAFAYSQISERENETARLPVRFDKVITTASITGK